MGPRATLVNQKTNRTRLECPAPGVIRLGVVGLGPRSHGLLGRAALYQEYEVAAVCDARPELVELAQTNHREQFDSELEGYLDYQEMLDAGDLDAVVVLTPSTGQVDQVCQALDAGYGAMCEVPLCTTIEDCWKLVAAVERTGKLFGLMEQLRFSGIARGWRRVVQDGVIGKPIFGEGEYFDHKADFWYQDERGEFFTPEQARQRPDATPGWRHTMDHICYLPHELSPLLYILQDRVVRVVGMGTRPQSYRFDNVEQSDIQVALMHTEKDTVLRLAVCYSSPAISRGCLGSHWWHIKGTEGVLESGRSANDKPKLYVEGWHTHGPVEMPWDTIQPQAAKAAAQSGHGGTDFYPLAQFADAYFFDVPMELDVYTAVETAAPAICAAQSIHASSQPIDVPDFRPGPHRQPGEIPTAASLP